MAGTRVAPVTGAAHGVPEDIAATVAFPVSDNASFLSGQVIYVAGGPRG